MKQSPRPDFKGRRLFGGKIRTTVKDSEPPKSPERCRDEETIDQTCNIPELIIRNETSVGENVVNKM